MGYYTCEDCDTDVPGVHESNHWDGVGGVEEFLAHRMPELCPLCTEIRVLKDRIQQAIDIGNDTYQGNGPPGPIVQKMTAALRGEE